MRVNRLALRNFRNYKELLLQFTHNINIFVGQNAQGKTNILEAVYLVALGRSHRTALDEELIRLNEQAASVEIAFNRQDAANIIQLKIIKNQNKEILINGHLVKARELIGNLNAVLFSPEDLWLVKGSPVNRRRFLDNEISQASPSYHYQLLQYNRIIFQRNTLLKKIREGKADRNLLDAWDGQMAKMAAAVMAKRLDVIKKLNMLANLMHRKITGNKENLTILYYQHGAAAGEVDPSSGWYQKKIEENRKNDIDRGSTGIGPHRDDLVLTVNGVNLRIYGSQGQQRTGILALKLAELEFIKSETGEYPVLLLDDVMSELDAVRREHLLTFIKDRIQTLITATDKQYFPGQLAVKWYNVENGSVTE